MRKIQNALQEDNLKIYSLCYHGFFVLLKKLIKLLLNN